MPIPLLIPLALGSAAGAFGLWRYRKMKAAKPAAASHPALPVSVKPTSAEESGPKPMWLDVQDLVDRATPPGTSTEVAFWKDLPAKGILLALRAMRATPVAGDPSAVSVELSKEVLKPEESAHSWALRMATTQPIHASYALGVATAALPTDAAKKRFLRAGPMPVSMSNGGYAVLARTLAEFQSRSEPGKALPAPLGLPTYPTSTTPKIDSAIPGVPPILPLPAVPAVPGAIPSGIPGVPFDSLPTGVPKYPVKDGLSAKTPSLAKAPVTTSGNGGAPSIAVAVETMLAQGQDPEALDAVAQIVERNGHVSIASKLRERATRLRVTNPERAKSTAKIYVLKSGDTCLGVARRFAGNDRRWRELLACNPGLVIKDRKMPSGGLTRVLSPWKPGVILRLPSDWSNNV